ncbi:hypothetical protein BgiBS90_003283 [Biomphalaria glabrata]|nr:hypothetical protein BgiBS90_003283 [Biomphalaria glabrata]
MTEMAVVDLNDGCLSLNSFKEKTQVWASKEIQLKNLQEEILNKRETLLRTSKNFLQRVSIDDLPVSDSEASLRNTALKQHINDLDAKIDESLSEQQSPRFSYLQTNYWSMVRNMFPIWKKSLEELYLGMAPFRSSNASP